MKKNNTTQKKLKLKLTLWQVIVSVLAAIFGVQSDKVRERDFTHGNPMMFITMGIIITTLFVLIIYGVVHFVLVK